MARQHFVDVIVHAKADGTLETFSGVTVDVFLRGTATRPSLFADVTGATVVSNPFTTPVGGAVEFCAEEGIDYDVKFHDNSARVADKTIRWGPARMPKVGDMRMAGQNEADSADGQWVVADGRAISRATFSALFAVLGTAHGVGDGTTTFNIPDMRGRVAFGAGNGPGLSPWVVGDKAGTEVLATANLPAHNHGVTDPGHQHNSWLSTIGNPAAGSINIVNISQVAGNFGDSAHPAGNQVTQMANNTTGVTIQNTGSGAAHWPPSIGVKYLVKVK